MFGKLSVSTNLGFILGPAIAGILAGTILGEALPVIAAVIISAIATVLIMGLPESSPCVLNRDEGQTSLRRTMGGETKPCYDLKGAPRLSTRQIISLPGVPLLLLIYFVIMMGFNCFYVALPMQAVHGLEWSIQTTGIFFAVLSAMMAFVQGPILARASRMWSDTTLVLAGSLALALSFMMFTQTSMVAIYTGAALMAVGNGVMWPSVVALLSKSAGDGSIRSRRSRQANGRALPRLACLNLFQHRDDFCLDPAPLGWVDGLNCRVV